MRLEMQVGLVLFDAERMRKCVEGGNAFWAGEKKRKRMTGVPLSEENGGSNPSRMMSALDS